VWVNPTNLSAADAERVLGKAIEREYNLADLLRRPGVTHAGLMSLSDARYASPELEALDTVSRETVVEQVEIAAKYAGYIDRQRDEVQRAAAYENLHLPEDLDYLQIPALSIEVRQKLHRQRPQTLGQASRISGITPAAISLLLIHLRRARYKGFAPEGDKAVAG
jgi:tRNA uridine 5-carboxymethylaminomethyl modification enzyme